MLQINNLSKAFGAQELFRDVTLQFSPRERVGLVGRNGSGKSTFFKIVTGELASDGGEVSIPKNYRLGILKQHLKFNQPTVLEEVCQEINGDPVSEAYKAEKILFGLGFSSEDMHKDPLGFSGGYQIRINLAKVLVAEPNMLLLDEPTNYLDIVSLRWLQRFLINFPGEVLIITHDREFMDAVCTHVMGISRKNIRKIKGDTAKYYEQILLDETIHEQTRANQERKKKELENFINRFKAKASKAKQAQSRVKQLEKMGTMDKLESEANMGFRFHFQECPGKFPLEAQNLSFRYDQEGDFLFDDITFSLGRQDRLAIIGKNGKGKSTLLKALMGDVKAEKGKVNFHSLSKVGYFGQSNVERLHPNNSIEQEIQEVNPDLGKTAVRNICGSMMFEGESADKKISVLSGGEKARVMLGKILAQPSNILLLDEPTNHLDMESIEILCEEIDRFPGAVIIVTHSEMLLKRLVNRLIVFHKGGAEFFHGDYEDFLRKIGWEEDSGEGKKKKSGLTHKEKRRLRAELTEERSKKARPLKEAIELAEDDIHKLEELLEKYNSLLAEKSSKGEEILETSEMIGKIHIKIEEKFSIMEESQLKLEEIELGFEEKLAALD